MIARETGIPISLSVLWACVAQRVGMECYLCVAMPRHVILSASWQSLWVACSAL